MLVGSIVQRKEMGMVDGERRWFWERRFSMMMQFLHNSYPSNQTYIKSKEDGCHDCEVGPLHKIEKMNNSNEDLKQL